MKRILFLIIWLVADLSGMVDERVSVTLLLRDSEVEKNSDDFELLRTSQTELSSLAQLFLVANMKANEDNLALREICERIDQGDAEAPIALVEAALEDVVKVFELSFVDCSDAELLTFTQLLARCQKDIATSDLDFLSDNDENDFSLMRQCGWKRIYNLLVRCSLLALNGAHIYGDISVRKELRVANEISVGDVDAGTGSVIVGNNVTVCGDETISGNLTVNGTFTAPTVTFNGFQIVGSPQQGCIIFTDSLFNEKARICSSTIPGDKGLFISVDGGITQNFHVNNAGGSVVAAPTSGAGLSVSSNASAPAVRLTGNGTTTAPALTLINNPASLSTDNLVTIDSSGVVTESALLLSDFIARGCQTGPLTIGTSDATSLILATNNCTPRLTISSNGGVTIATPAAAEVGLTIQGGGEVITAGDLVLSNGNVTLPAATGGAVTSAAIGLLELGGANASTTNVSIFNVGTRNIVAGNYATVPSITGNDNISVGSSSNSTLTTANNTIAIGNAAVATASDTVAFGTGATASAARAIAMASRDSTAAGVAPVASAVNAIAIGSAQGANAGAVASAGASMAIGSADAVFAGASALAARTLAIGVNARAGTAAGHQGAIAIGSASGVFSGGGAQAINTDAIAIGSANGTRTAPVASNVGSVAIGSGDAVFAGPSVVTARSICIGTNARVTSGDGAIGIGSASGVASGTGPLSSFNSIVIGSANGSRIAAQATSSVGVSIGGADTVFPGAITRATTTIALGVNAQAGLTTAHQGSVAIGSASGVAGGLGAQTSQSSALAVGSANGANTAAIASGTSSVAIGGAGSGVAGALASGVQSFALGLGARALQDNALVLGNAATAAVRVGIGSSTPAAKLHVANSNTTGLLVTGTATFPVVQLTAGSTVIQSQPVWLNPATSGTPGIPIHYDASNRLFGFSSSARYKTNIRSLESSAILYDLNPVLYDAREGHGEGKDIPGFIAEDTYKMAPQLAILNAEKQPENIAYNSILALSIKEIQKHQQIIEKQENIIQTEHLLIDQLLFQVEQLINKKML